MPRILALVGDYYHCSDQLLLALSPVLQETGSELFLTRYPDPPAPRELAGYDLVILAMMGRLRPRESKEYWFDDLSQRALEAAVSEGAGLLLFHSGTASHPDDGALRRLSGGHFVQHPPEHPVVTITPVAEHPITSGVGEFAHPDEHYFMEIDDDVTQLLRASSTLGEQSAGWCKTHGAGRVAAIVPGHTREMLEDPALRLLLRNSVQWCLRTGE